MSGWKLLSNGGRWARWGLGLWVAVGLLLTIALLAPVAWAAVVEQSAPAYAKASVPAAKAPQPAKQVIVLLADGLSLSDLSPQGTPHLWRMQAQGAIGVMNQNTLGAINEVNSYLTIGAGTKAAAPKNLTEAYASNELVPSEVRAVTGGELYVRNTGLAPHGNIVFPDVPQMTKQTLQERYTIVPGLLGSAVEQAGFRTAVLGNADLGTEVNRPAVLLAMNQYGTVDDGDLHAGVMADPTWPYGLRTDVSALYNSYRTWRGRDSLLVLQTGDLLRMQAADDQLDDANKKRLHDLAVQAVDRLVGLLWPERGPNTLLAVIAPVRSSDPALPPLSPVLLAGGDFTHSSLLQSSTTRRAGLVANYDLAPTFVQFLGIETNRYPFLGQPIRAVPDSRFSSLQQNGQTPAVQLANLVKQMQVPNLARRLMLRPWLNVWIGLTILLGLAVFFRHRSLRLLQPLTTLMLIFPLAWLLVPLYEPQTVLSTVLFTLAVALTIWGVLLSLPDVHQRLGLIAGATVLTLLLDVLLGAPLEKQALLSYDPIAGARYYGIGNEYMGVLLGALLLLLNLWLGQTDTVSVQKRIVLLVGFLFVVYLFAAPGLGTNAGGAISAAVCGGYALLLLGAGSIKWRHLAVFLATLLAVGLGMALLNLQLPSGEQTHIGRATSQLLGGQFAEVYQIIARKIWLNLTLLRASAWGKLFLSALAVLVLWMVQHRKLLQESRQLFSVRHSKMVLVTALAAFAFNDSGVVAASLTLLYAIVPLAMPEAKLEAQKRLPAAPSEAEAEESYLS